MFAVLRRRNYALLWTGGMVSALGDWVLFIALPFYIYNLTGSALATGGMFIAETLAQLLLGPVAGVFVDRWDHRATMIGSDVLRALLLLPLLFVHDRETVWIIYVVAMAESAMSQFFGPAKNALIPRLVASDDLVPANSLSALGDNLTRLVGPSIGGAMMAILGFSSVVTADIFSFAFSAASIGLIVTNRDSARVAEDGQINGGLTIGSVWNELVDGFGIVRRDRLVTGIFVAMAATMIGQGIINTMLVPFVKDVLRGDALTFGLLPTAQSVGGLVGGLVMAKIGSSIGPTRLLAGCALVLGVLLVAIANASSLAMVLGLTAAAGLPAIGFFVTAQTLLQRGVGDRYKGRVFGAFGTLTSGALLIGMAVASTLGDPLGVRVLIDVAGVFYALGAPVALGLFLRTEPPVAAMATGESG